MMMSRSWTAASALVLIACVASAFATEGVLPSIRPAKRGAVSAITSVPDATDIEYTGTFVKVMEDHFAEGFAVHRYGLTSVDNGLNWLEIAKDDVEAMFSEGRSIPINTRVTIRGHHNNRTQHRGRAGAGEFIVHELTRAHEKRINGGTPPSVGAVKVLTILINLANSTYGTNAACGCSVSQAQTNLYTGTPSVNGMWQFASRNQISMTQANGAVYGPVTIQARTIAGSNNQFECLPDDWAAAAQNVAAAAGFPANSYDIVHHFLPNIGSTNCGWGGLAQIGARNSWTVQCGSKGTSAHELGHNIGFQHASSLVGGNFVEYGDGTCVMGDDGSVNDLGTSYHILHRQQAGWLNYANAFVTITNNGNVQSFTLQDYNVAPSALTASSPWAIQFVVPDGRFTFSYHVRASGSYDTGLASPNTVVAHFYAGGFNDHPIRMGNFLAAGNSYYNATGGWTVKVVSTAAASASVTVTYDAKVPCQTSVASQGFEGGLGGYTLATTNSAITPTTTTSKSAPSSLSTSVNMVGQPTSQIGVQSLTSTSYTIPSTGTSTLSFQMSYRTDGVGIVNNAGYCLDGALVSIVVGGVKTQLTGSYPYTAAIYNGAQNPYAGKQAWCGEQTGWQVVNIAVSQWAGQTVSFVWEFATDNFQLYGNSPNGVFIDAITLTNAASCARVGGSCTAQANSDAVGSDTPFSPYQVADAPACCAQCQTVSGANSYVVQPSNGNCWCKTLASNVNPSAANDRTFGRFTKSCTSQVNNDLAGSDSPNSPYTVANAGACCTVCQSVSGANSFVIQPSTGLCWCKTLAASATPYAQSDRTFGRFYS